MVKIELDKGKFVEIDKESEENGGTVIIRVSNKDKTKVTCIPVNNKNRDFRKIVKQLLPYKNDLERDMETYAKFQVEALKINSSGALN